MRIKQGSRQPVLFSLALFSILLTFVLAACGSSTSTGSGGSQGSTPTVAPTTGTGATSSTGCPNSQTVNTAPTTANVVLKQADNNTVASAKKGDIIEVQLPFGQAWTGPTTSQGVLELQNPSGYAWQSANACIWRFVAQGTGTTNLEFMGKAICKPGQACPQYIIRVAYTVDVK